MTSPIFEGNRPWPERPAETPALGLGPPAAPARQRRRPGKVAGLAATIAVSAALGAALMLAVGSDGSATPAPLAPAAGAAVATSTQGSATSMSFADIYATNRPSVVVITSISSRGQGGLGSGVVLDSEGLIITNYHVVEGATSLEVTFADGFIAAARVVKTDEAHDLALIDVDGDKDFQPVAIADSDSLRAGDPVVAIGNPFGLEGTVTTGIVSGLDRELVGTRTSAGLEGLIQFDAAINSGNSGGGLFNSRGELIGIPTAIENPTGNAVFIGIGLAVPINTAQETLLAGSGL